MKKMTPEVIHSRRWATLAVLCLSLLLVVVDSSIVNVALPTLSSALHASTTSLQWIIDAYTLRGRPAAVPGQPGRPHRPLPLPRLASASLASDPCWPG